ncbi:MAG: phage terminase large subunit [bacterium]|nr:phage terminase large subunit [bacterium]
MIDNLLVTMPPRHGKSEVISKYFIAWYLGMYPRNKVILGSYGADFAAEWGAKVRDLLIEYGLGLFGVRPSPRSSAANAWSLVDEAGRATEGGMVSCGARGPITGRGGNILVADDLVKNDEEALSATMREKTWDWWQATFSTRGQPGARTPKILVMTRWHADDVAGRLLKLAKEDPEADQWAVLNLPALAEAGGDVLGRTEGQVLCAPMFNSARLKKMKHNMAPHWWSALFQQRPQTEGGGIFKKKWFKYWTWRSREHLIIDLGNRVATVWDGPRFVTVDLAASQKTTADFTVMQVWGLYGAGDTLRLVLLDMERERMGGEDYESRCKQLMAKWRPAFFGVESAAMQLAIVDILRSFGIPCRELVADKDKVARAIAMTPWMSAGAVYFPAHAEWLDDYEEELLLFDKGDHDDMVDATSYAAALLHEFGITEIPIGEDVEFAET